MSNCVMNNFLIFLIFFSFHAQTWKNKNFFFEKQKNLEIEKNNPHPFSFSCG